MIYSRIKILCKQNGISVNELEKRLDIAKGSLCRIDKHKPSQEKIENLANELKTTTDYIMKGENPNSAIEISNKDIQLSNMTERIKEHSLKLSNLPKDKQEQVISFINFIEKE